MIEDRHILAGVTGVAGALCFIAFNLVWYQAIFALRRKGIRSGPFPALRDYSLIRDLIERETDPGEKSRFIRIQRRLRLDWILFGLGVMLVVICAAISE